IPPLWVVVCPLGAVSARRRGRLGQVVDVPAHVGEGGEGLVQGVARDDVDVAGVLPSRLVIGARDEEYVVALRPHRRGLLPGSTHGPDRAVAVDRARDRHVGTTGQVAGGQVV